MDNGKTVNEMGLVSKRGEMEMSTSEVGSTINEMYMGFTRGPTMTLTKESGLKVSFTEKASKSSFKPSTTN